MCGGFIGGWIANRFGRKGGLLINNVVGIVAALAMVFSKYITSYELLIIGRYLIGVNCGKILNLKKNKIQISNWLEPTEAFSQPKSVAEPAPSLSGGRWTASDPAPASLKI